MRIIQTTAINDALNQDQPLLGASIDFLTQNQIETLSAIVQNLIGPSYSSSQVYVLWGCVVTGVTSGSGNFAMTAGAIFYGGEIFQIAAVTTVAVGIGNAVYSTMASNPTTTDPYTGTRALDPITMSDGVTTINAHLTRTWVTSIATSGPNPVNGWIYINSPVPLQVGSGSNPAYGANFVANDGLYFYKKANGEVIIFGDAISNASNITNPGVLFTLPAGYRPAGTRAIGFAVGSLSSGGSGTVGAQIVVTSAGAVTFETFNIVTTVSSPTANYWSISFSPFVAGQ